MSDPKKPAAAPTPAPVAQVAPVAPAKRDTIKPAVKRVAAKADAQNKLNGIKSDLASGLAKKATVKAPETTTLPQNKWTNRYNMVKDLIKENPSYKGSFANAILGVLLFMSKYSGVIENFASGGFMGSLDSKEYKKEVFSAKEMADLLEKRKDSKNTPEVPKEKNLHPDVASTRYACSFLGIEKLDSPKVLATRLLHSQKGGKKLFQEKSLVDLRRSKKQGKPLKGTVIFFTLNLQKAGTMVGHAIDDNGNFRYYDGKNLKTINLNDIKTAQHLKAAFIPLDVPDVPDRRVLPAKPRLRLKAKLAVKQAKLALNDPQRFLTKLGNDVDRFVENAPASPATLAIVKGFYAQILNLIKVYKQKTKKLEEGLVSSNELHKAKKTLEFLETKKKRTEVQLGKVRLAVYSPDSV